MTKEEKKMFDDLPSQHHKYWVPCQWFANLLACSREEGRILDNYGFNKILEVSRLSRRLSPDDSLLNSAAVE